MKKLTTLALAAGLIVAAAAPASAVDTKVGGEYLFSFGRNDLSYDETYSDKEIAQQRLRLNLTFTASENLSGFAQFQAAEKFGENHNALMTTGIRQAYIDWMIPGTPVKVRMGKIQFGMPAHAFGQNATMAPGHNRSAVILSAPVADWMDVSAFWHRAAYKGEGLSDGSNDGFGVFANMKFDGLTVTPWAMYAIDSTANTETYWAEATAALTLFDPLTVKATLGGAQVHNRLAEDVYAWHVMALASYKTAFGTPVFGAWYGNGAEKGETTANNTIPFIGAAGKFAPSYGFYNNTWGLDSATATNISGTWGIKLGIENVSFLEGLTHDFAVVMAKGTNHKTAIKTAEPLNNMSWSDTMYDFNFGTTYQIYKNLAANLQLAYILNDLDEDLHKDYDENGWRAVLSFKYAF